MEFRRWYYLQESVDLEVLLTEGFKEKKQQFLTQGANREEIDEYFPIFQRIQKTNYKKVADVIPGLTVAIPDRRNIDKYPNFDQLKIFVDYMRSQENLEVDIEVVGEPIFENNILEISYADSPRACITYKGNVPYGWCVSRKTDNYYYAYRLQPSEPAFYFVKNKIRTEKELSSWNPKEIKEGIKWNDKWHFFIIQVILVTDPNNKDATDHRYVVTSADNDGDVEMSWSQIVQLEPALSNMQHIFKPVALPPEDRAFVERWQNGASDEEFANMSFKEKSKFMAVYVRLGRGLTDNQFASLPPSLWNEYLNFGVGLTDNQFEMIKNRRDLVNRYIEISTRKFNDLITDEVSLFYMKPSELKILADHHEKLNWDKMNDIQMHQLLGVKNGVTLIFKHKQRLPFDVETLLIKSGDLSELKNYLGPEDYKKISWSHVIVGPNGLKINTLLSKAKDKQGIIELFFKHRDRKRLTTEEINEILLKTPNISTIRDELNSAITDSSDVQNQESYWRTPYLVGDLLKSANDKQGVAEILVDQVKNINEEDFLEFLKFTPKISVIENKFKPEILKKINFMSNSTLYMLFGVYSYTKDAINLVMKHRDQISDILTSVNDVSKMLDKLEPQNLEKVKNITPDELSHLMPRARDRQGIANLLLELGVELDKTDILVLLFYMPELAELEYKLGPENLRKINLLNGYEISSILSRRPEDSIISDLILTYKTDMDLDEIMLILSRLDNPNIEQKLGQKNLNKLSSLRADQIEHLILKSKNKVQTIDLLINYGNKPNLLSIVVKALLETSFFKHLGRFEERVGSENFKKLILSANDDQIRLLSKIFGNKEIAELLAKYRQK